MSSNFGFLRAEWPQLFGEAAAAERLAAVDPRVACFYARRVVELAVDWLYDADATVKMPYRDDLSAKLNEPTFQNAVDAKIRMKMDFIRRRGNVAVHRPAPVPAGDAVAVVAELFQVMYWLARTYSAQAENIPAAGVSFDAGLIPKPVSAEVRRKKQAEVAAMAAEAEKQRQELAEARKRNQALDAELAELRATYAAAKKARATVVDTHDYGEADTRKNVIDLLLNEAGWLLDRKEDREFLVTGLEGTPSGTGRVDYVLWDDDGKPLAVVEAKRTSKDAEAGKNQARRYADALEQMFGRRPVIFYTNGYETWLWDDLRYPPREVRGYYTKDELRLLINRRAGRKSLRTELPDDDIAGRDYQQRAIRRIDEEFEDHNRRKALLVMATGTGKTRTVIALVDQLMRAGWVKRVLFLADRQALVTQAHKAFKAHLRNTNVSNLLNDKNNTGARVYVSTYPTMMNLINEVNEEGLRRFGPGHFDLVIVDEAHRSVYQKYRAIFEHFDSLLVGLTATPREDIDHNTYSLFELEDGVPTDSYGLEEAVAEDWLVPSTAVDVPLKFVRRGIRYDELSDAEKLLYDELEWAEDDSGLPRDVDADEINKFLFNDDTMDKMLQVLMQRGIRVQDGDRLGKTIIFARNNEHAKFIVKRFDVLYPEYKGEFAQLITHQIGDAQTLIDKFSIADSAPHIAVSVDMLDTGIDVPEVVNLVFAKPVRSKTKYWQMIGRGTRLCPNLFGPGEDEDKEEFRVFDLCGNVEFFNQNIPAADSRIAMSVHERLFRYRAELLAALDADNAPSLRPTDLGDRDPRDRSDLRWQLVDRLHAEITGMNPLNVEVRKHLREVEEYGATAEWKAITEDVLAGLEKIAGLPTEFRDAENSQDAKRFDVLVLRLQLAVIAGDTDYARLRDQIREIATDLLDPTLQSIPIVRDRTEFITDVAGEPWWEDVTLPMLETLRRRLRALVKLIPKQRRATVFTHFKDELGELADVEVKAMSTGKGMARFESKVRAYLNSHTDELAVQKLRRSRQITTADLAELELIFIENDYGTAEDIEYAASRNHGFGPFLRRLAGLDRDAVEEEFAAFRSGRVLSANQLHFLKLLIDVIAKNGIIEVGDLYGPQFSQVAPNGPEGLFSDADVDTMAAVIKHIRATADPETDTRSA